MAMISKAVRACVFFTPPIVISFVFLAVTDNPLFSVLLLAIMLPVFAYSAALFLGHLQQGFFVSLFARGGEMWALLLVDTIPLAILFFLNIVIWMPFDEPEGTVSDLVVLTSFAALLAVPLVRLWPSYAQPMVDPREIDIEGFWKARRGAGGPGFLPGSWAAAWRLTRAPGTFVEHGIFAVPALVAMIVGGLIIMAQRDGLRFPVPLHAVEAIYVLLVLPLANTVLCDRTRRLLPLRGPVEAHTACGPPIEKPVLVAYRDCYGILYRENDRDKQVDLFHDEHREVQGVSLSAAEALSLRYAHHITRAGGDWFLPFLRDLSEGKTIDKSVLEREILRHPPGKPRYGL